MQCLLLLVWVIIDVRPCLCLFSLLSHGGGRSVFAYGQTSTGKTHTMQGTEDHPGVIPLAIEECFSYVSTSNDDR